MDYEKKIREYLNSDEVDQLYKSMLINLFPELTESESEDEKIRNEITDFICWATDRGSITKEQREKSNSWLAWLEKQKDTYKDTLKDTLKDIEQKPDWSDEYKGLLEAQYQQGYEDGKKVHVNVEWSEEDEQYLLICKNALAKYQISDKWDAGIISRWLEDRLKSLRPQKQWKPTEEQIKVVARLRHCLLEDVRGNDIVILDNLLEQLKAIGGE